MQIRASKRRWIGLLGVASALSALATIAPAPMAHAGSLAVVGGESLDLKADRLHVDVQKGTALLEGNVAVQMGELAVSCPKVDIRYDEAPQVRWARGSGGVTAQIKGITATANVMALDVAERTVQLSGNVRLSRGRGWVEADRATIDINTRKVNLHDVKGSIPVQPPAR